MELKWRKVLDARPEFGSVGKLRRRPEFVMGPKWRLGSLRSRSIVLCHKNFEKTKESGEGGPKHR